MCKLAIFIEYDLCINMLPAHVSSYDTTIAHIAESFRETIVPGYRSNKSARYYMNDGPSEVDQ